MKFTFRGVEYRLGFQHTTTTKTSGTRTVYKLITTAYIRTGVRDQDEQIVAKGTFTHYGKSAFSREIARQQAIKNILDATSLPMVDLTAFHSAVNATYHRRPGGLDYARAVRKGLITATCPLTMTLTGKV